MTACNSRPTTAARGRVGNGLRAGLRRIRPRRCAFMLTALTAAAWSADARADFTSTPVTSVRVGQPYQYDIVAIGSGQVLITAPNGLPPWLTLTPTGNGTATLSGTPRSGDTGAGITLRSEDTACRVFLILCYRFQNFDITIVENTVPTVVGDGISDQSALEGEPFSLDVSEAFADADGDPLTFTVTGLPPSLAVGGGLLSGTPTVADAEASPYEVTVTADDGNGGRVSESFGLTVAALDRAAVSLEAIEPTPAPVVRGETVDWVFTVANAGPSPTDSVDLTIEFAGNPFAFDEQPCTLTVADDRQRLDCTVGPIEAGESASLTITGSAAQAGDAFVTAEIAAAGLPLDPSDDDNAAWAALNVGRAINENAAQTLDGAPATAVAAGDVDGDGFDDAAVVTGADEPTALHLNLPKPESLHPMLADDMDSRRGLSTVPLSLDGAAAGAGAALGDVDGDGDVDLVVANGAGAANTLYLNDGDGSLAAAEPLGGDDVASRAVALADLDGDGFVDVVFANAGVNTVHMNQGGAGFAESALTDGDALSSRGVAAVDVVGDPLPDLIFANDDGPATLHENLGGGSFGAAVTIDAGPTSSVASGDFNGDGRADLVFGRAAPGPAGLPSNPVYSNNGAGAFVAINALGASPTVAVATGDVDGDGALDIVSINGTGAHQVFVGDGDGGFSLHRTLFVSRGASAAALGDVGLGAGLDVVVAGEPGVAVYFNDGSGGLGLGDTVRPVIELVGDAEVTLQVEGTYTDAGATATDDVDGVLTPDVDDPVDSKVIGSYTVTYKAVDSSGNAALPVTRTVRVEAREASGGGGGGAAGFGLLALGALAWLGRRRARSGRAVPDAC